MARALKSTMQEKAQSHQQCVARVRCRQLTSGMLVQSETRFVSTSGNSLLAFMLSTTTAV